MTFCIGEISPIQKEQNNFAAENQTFFICQNTSRWLVILKNEDKQIESNNLCQFVLEKFFACCVIKNPAWVIVQPSFNGADFFCGEL